MTILGNKQDNPLTLTSRVKPMEANNRTDINGVRDAMCKIGEYNGAPKDHYDRFMMDAPLRTSIERFQKKKGLEVDGTLLPGGETEREINKSLFSQRKQTQKPKSFIKESKETQRQNGERLLFDGEYLIYEEKGEKVRSWKAVSGAPGYQTKEFQSKARLGPLPEGKYMVNQNRLQNYDDISFADKIASKFKGGTWPRGRTAWGNHRVWLEPDASNTMYERDTFSLHGGAKPGSAGCVDLTDQMDDFTNWFKNKNANLHLDVKYKK